MNAELALSPPQMLTNGPYPESNHSTPSSAGYERVRVVGKGAFGAAILYRRKDDDSLVILKEINLHDLTSSERLMALNEVALLSRFNHPNIISYYDSFEENGILAIEQEYAEGGTLSQFLAQQTSFVKESVVRRMFREMISAVSYLHDHDVLHRDLKTSNVFLTQEKMIKIGDFGISKKMGTQTKFNGAVTILGTPHYLSPEMCEGRPYNSPSDIWALGCCLYEMLSLQKAFDGTSLPALVRKIVSGEYEPIRGPYCSQLKLMVRQMLKVDPQQRPSASELFDVMQPHRRLEGPSPAQQQESGKRDGASNTLISSPTQKQALSSPPPPSSSFSNSSTNRIFYFEDTHIETAPVERECHSALYSFDVTKVALTAVEGIAPKMKIKQLCISRHHQLVLTTNAEVFSWGDNANGKLGQGDRKPREVPTRIDTLADKSISRIAVGSDFSIFCADKGIVMACGNRKYMGGAVAEDWLRPRLLESLLREDIVDLACGEEHAAALSAGGEVFVWGSGEGGRLGIGNGDFVSVPTKIEIPTRQLISNVKCGLDCTVLLTTCGTLIATGSNKYNKLNLNDCRMGFFGHAKARSMRSEVAVVSKPTPVRPFPSRVVDISLGVNHTGVLLENGHIHLFGRNEDGELGMGATSKCTPPCIAQRPVKALSNKTCTQLICGDGFTMAGTSDNELYFWGARSRGFDSSACASGDDTLIAMAEALASFTAKESVQGQSPLEKKKLLFNKSASIDKQPPKRAWHKDPCDSANANGLSVITQPTLFLRLDVTRASSAPYHSGTHYQHHNNNCSSLDPFIRLSALACCLRKVMVIIDTSPSMATHTPVGECDGGGTETGDKRIQSKRPQIPIPISTPSFTTTTTINSSPSSQQRRRCSAPEKSVLNANATTDTIADWIQKELDNAEYISYNRFVNGQLDSDCRSAELRLFSEIDSIKRQMQEQRQTFKGHEKELALLQNKMAQLQTLSMVEPPPAYGAAVSSNLDSKAPIIAPSIGKRPKTMKNTFLPEVQQSSACTIL